MPPAGVWLPAQSCVPCSCTNLYAVHVPTLQVPALLSVPLFGEAFTLLKGLLALACAVGPILLSSKHSKCTDLLVKCRKVTVMPAPADRGYDHDSIDMKHGDEWKKESEGKEGVNYP